MISTRKRPMILGGMLLPAVAGSSRLSDAQEATAAKPTRPSPPTQPATGPGGADYLYDTVIASAYRKDSSRVDEARPAIYHFWLFEPADPRPGAPAADVPLPVVIFLSDCCDFHRWATGRPDSFRSWIDHLVRRGAVVVYPMEADYFFGMEAVENMKLAVADALMELDSGEHLLMDLDRVAVVGLGLGGSHAVNLVASPPDGMLDPTALFLVGPFMPSMDGPNFQVTEAIEAIPAETHVALVGAEDDDFEEGLDEVWLGLSQAGQVPVNQRAYVVLPSDDHGRPALVADGWNAHTDGTDLPGVYVDALDWYGTWKLLDGLMACTFEGEFCEYVFGDTPEARFMGEWSDGVPVTEALVMEDAGTPDSTPSG